MNAADIANLINYAFVLFFGIIAAFYMADLPFEEHHWLYALTLPGIQRHTACMLSAAWSDRCL